MPPLLRIDSVRRIFDDGNHNAFTDLCRFRGQLYLTFRSCPDGHMLFTSSQIVVLRSADGQAWQEVCRFGVPDRDVRDPHFLVFDDRLFVLSGTWWVDPVDSANRDINHHLGYGVWSEDGETWQGPQLLNGTHGHYIWRAAARDGVAYLDARRVAHFAVVGDRAEQQRRTESWLLHSQDGLNWLPLTRMVPNYGGETAFLFEEDGSILAVSRLTGNEPAHVCRSQPPYTTWQSTALDRMIGGPFVARWGDHYLTGGRKKIGDQPPVTTLYWLIDDQLHEAAELPSGGDNSYPGFVQISPTRALLSYYSSHEGSGSHLAPAAIYLAELHLD